MDVNDLKNLSDSARMDQISGSGVRITKRQLQAMKTKDKIYSAAVKEINEKGFSNVSIEDITTAANVAKGTFYTHFESKEALVFYTFMQSDKFYKRAYEKVKDLDFLSMVTGFVRISYIENEKRGKGILKAMISSYFTASGYNFYSRDRFLIQCLEMIVEQGKRQGALDGVVSTHRYVDILLSTMVGVEVMWCFDNQGLGLTDIMEDAIRVTAKGMLK